MATIKFEHINKIYQNNVQAVFDFNLEVKDKEFVVFVGPSGCGKSTTLRMLAGLEDISTGKLYIDDILMNEVVPMNRNIAMVFQNYALYPHMSVAKNMGFALKYRKHKQFIKDAEGNQVFSIDDLKVKELEKELHKQKKNKKEDNLDKIQSLEKDLEYYKSTPTEAYKLVKYTKEEIKAKVSEASEILGLTQYLNRKPKELSGGQRQRVALGRAIVRDPKVFLMDEPLSNLDAKLRVAMRSEITRIHREVGATTIYVTHDQTEAMTMADRIVCMKDGYVQQIGTPEELYNTPANIFVGGFIGSPAMNFFNGMFDGKKFIFDNENENEKVCLELDKDSISLLKDYENKELILGIRPENIYQEESSKHPHLSKPLLVKCDVSELLGNEYVVYGKISNQNVVIKTDADNKIVPGNKYTFMFNLDKISFFDKETTNRIKNEGN